MKKRNLLLLFITLFFVSGCSFSKNVFVKSIDNFFKVDSIDTYHSIGGATYETAYDLSSLINLKELQKRKVIITSLVNVNNFDETSDFGRLYSESMMTDLRNKNWDIIDFRGQSVVSIDKKGEFFLDRKKLASFPKDSFVFVGTYGEYDKGLLLNQRLIHMLDNKVITVSALMIKDHGKSLALSKKDNCMSLKCKKVKKTKNIIHIVEDDCTNGKNCFGDKNEKFTK